MNKAQKKLVKVYLLMFLASFMFINWNSISWLFNYRELSGLLDDFFTPYENAEASPLAIYNQNSSSQIKENQIEFAYSEKENIIEIPEIGISAPISFPENTNAEVLAKALNKGPIYYPGSVLPAEKGQIIILGHSAPENWPKIKYDWVFSDLEELSAGSKIFIYLNHREYIYNVKEKSIIQKGQEISSNGLTNNNNTLILVSCWPPGKNLQRIAVRAELSI